MFRDGRERKLKYPLYRRYGQTLIAAEDLANAINGSFSLDEWEHEVTLSADVLRIRNFREFLRENGLLPAETWSILW